MINIYLLYIYNIQFGYKNTHGGLCLMCISHEVIVDIARGRPFLFCLFSYYYYVIINDNDY